MSARPEGIAASEDQDLTTLPGVGAVRAARLARLGLETLGDLLRLAPRRLESHAGMLPVAEARDRIGEEVVVRGTLGPYRFFRKGGRRSVLSLKLSEGDDAIEAFWFGQPWMRDRLGELRRAGEPVVLSGRVVRSSKGPALATPRVSALADFESDAGRARLVPVYPSTEGLGQTLLRALVAEARRRVEPVEDLEPELLAAHDLPCLPEAIEELHVPSTHAAHRRARRRLALERSIELEAELELVRSGARGARARAIVLAHGGAEGGDGRERLWSHFPFEPTGAQRRVLDEVLDDLAHDVPMRRLLQGDVGSGKTLVALAVSLAVAEAGGQVAFLAPTECLAEQHALGLAGWPASESLRPVLLTGSTPAAERQARLEELADGRSRLAIGTHALLSRDVRFRRLDLVVIDEQQRFGVGQRRSLLSKGSAVHALSMTATPIPRTMALALYGDLQHSRLDEKPPGRLPIETRLHASDARERVLESVGSRVAAGERAFWVCPRIEVQDEAEDDPGAAERAFAALSDGLLADWGIELVHGRLEARERARRLERFRAGEARTLVATSVIEVGVDVPQASLMVVEGAERFGLSQLHQLRGRIGRGPTPSTCFLLAAEDAHERLAVLTDEQDGFRIAEVDLVQRGMGELAGVRQSGHHADGFLDPLLDEELLALARRLVADDPQLVQRHLERRSERAALDETSV